MSHADAESPFRSRTVWLCAALHAFTHIYWVALTPLYLKIQEGLGLASVSQVTLLVTVMMIAYFVPSYPVGVLADRFSRKRLLAVGLLVNSLAFIGLGCSRTFGAALGCAVLAGLGGSFYHPAATALVARRHPVQTGRALGLVGIGASVGFFVGPVYAGWRAQVSGWQAPLIELGMAGVIMTGVFWYLARDSEPSVPAAAPVVAHSPPRRMAATWWFTLLTAALFLSLRDFSGSAVGSGGALFLQQAHGFTLGRSGFALSMIFLGSAVGNPFFGQLADRRLAPGLLLVLSAAAGMTALFGRLPGGWMIPAFLVYGFFFMGSYPMTEAAVVRAIPDAIRGRAVGVFMTVGGLVGNMAHWWVGGRIERLGDAASDPAAYVPLFVILAAMILASLGALPWLLKLGSLAAAARPSQPDPTP
ncbi:MAG: MFS transporter [Verrucomicrobiales bacterium]|nr:MFS transporter [Verrucomicrobiales bacterium]